MADIGPGLNSTAAQKRARTVYAAATSKETKTLLAQAKEFVRQHAAEFPITSIEFNSLARSAGILPANAKIARKEMGYASKQINGEWYIMPPEETEEAEPVALVASESFNDLERAGEATEDQFNVSLDERRAWGVKDDEVVCWQRSPEVWNRLVPGGNMQGWLRANPGARLVMDHGQMIYNGEDVVLCAVPRKVVEERIAEKRRECAALEREVIANEEGFRHADDFDLADDEKFERAKRITHSKFKGQGSSPSSGKDIESFVRREGLSEMDILRFEAQYALKGTGIDVHSMSDKEFMELVNPVPESGGRGEQPRGSGGRFSSTAPVVRARNLMSESDRQRLAVR